MKAIETLQRLGLVKALKDNLVYIDKWYWVHYMLRRRSKRKAKPVTTLGLAKKLEKLGFVVLVV